MSTRSCIARRHGDGFLGVYHHWDGYPTALGKTLWNLVTGKSEAPFAGDIRATLKVLIDEHPAGWSTINGADWSQAPGFVSLRSLQRSPDANSAPQCYCHGDRAEEAQPITEADDQGMEWAYIFDEETGTMAVLERVRGDGPHAVGMFGTLGVDETGERNDCWLIRWVGSLDGPEPDWRALQGGES